MRSINYDGCSFSYPEPLFLSVPPEGPGIYAVQVANPAWQPLSFEPIYIGESEDLDVRGLPYEHHAFGRWCEHPAVQAGEVLYVSYLNSSLPEPELSKEIERLIARYRPSCNRTAPERAHGLLGAQLAGTNLELAQRVPGQGATS